MRQTLRQITKLTGGEIIGDENTLITNAAGIAEAKGRGDLVPGEFVPRRFELAIDVSEEIEGLYHGYPAYILIISIKNYTRRWPPDIA